MRVGGQHVPTNQTRLRNKNPRSRRNRALGSWRSCGFPDVAALRANGGTAGGLTTARDSAANRTKPTAQTMITLPNAAIGPPRRRRYRGTWWSGSGTVTVSVRLILDRHNAHSESSDAQHGGSKTDDDQRTNELRSGTEARRAIRVR